MKYSIKESQQHRADDVIQKPLWRRINILDVIFIVIILLIALIIASYFAPFSLFGVGGEQKIISYTIEIENVDAVMVDNIKIGDMAYDSNGKNDIGIVTAVKSSDTVKYVYNSELGVLESSVYPVNSDGNVPKTLKITIQATADYNTGSGYTVNGNRISIGNSMSLCFTEYTGSGNCISLYIIGDSTGVSK